MRIEHFLKISAEKLGNEPAIVSGGRAHSYADLARAAARIAAALADRGVRHGDRVAILMDTTPAAVAVTFGILSAGGVVCVADKTGDAEALAGFISEHRPAALAVDAKYAALAASALSGAADIGVVLLNGGGAGATGANCLSVGDLIGRLGTARDLPGGGTGGDAAMVIGGLEAAEAITRPITLSHDELAAGAGSTLPRSGQILRSMFTFTGFCHLAQAIRTGVTIVLDAPFEPRRGGGFLAGQPVLTPLLGAV